jgi:hypothetical protein
MGKVVSKKRTKRDIERLRKEIQCRLDRKKAKLGFALKVIEETRQEAGWLTFIVVPDGLGVRAYDYAHTLTEVEDEVEKEAGEHYILLLPALPD